MNKINCAQLGHLALAITAMAISQYSHAVGNIDTGTTSFENQCSICHTTIVGKNGFGPSLAEIFWRRAGSVPNYKYTSAMANTGLICDSPTLDAFLASSTVKVPGTVMSVSITDASTRANIIAYLATLGTAAADATTSGVPRAASIGGGPTGDELLRASTDPHNWLYASKGYEGQRYAPSTQITVANAVHLRPVCIYRSETIPSMQSSPLVYRGTMYLTFSQVHSPGLNPSLSDPQ